MEQQSNPKQSEPEHVSLELPPQRAMKSEDLLHDDKEVLILHRGEVYRLRETRNGKLILSK